MFFLRTVRIRFPIQQAYLQKKDLSVFQENKTIYAYIINGSVTSDPIALKLTKPSEQLQWLYKLKETSTFNLLSSNTAGITVPKDIKLIGGAKINMDFIKLPIGVDITGDKFKISFGANVFDTEDPDYWNTFKKCCDAYNVDENKTVDQMQKLKNQLIANKFGKNSNKKATFSTELLGYLEGEIVNGKAIVTAVSGSVAVKFLFTYAQNFSFGPVPVYLSVEAGADASLDFTKARLLADDDVPFDLGITLNITPSVKVSGGVGAKGVASAGVWGKGSLPFKNNFSTYYRYVALKGEFGLEGGLLFLSGELKLLEGEKVIYEGYYKSSKARKAIRKSFDASQGMAYVEANNQNFNVSSRDYAENTSKWLGTKSNVKRAKAKSAGSGAAVSDLKQSVFANSKTQIVKFGDKLMAAWIDDDSSRDDYNRLSLVYSIYENGSWSEPKAVYDDGFGYNDDTPSLASDGENVYIAWQKSVKKMTEEDGIDSALESTEIYFAEYDNQNDKFINSYRVTNNNTYDYAPSVSVNNGKAVLCFVNNNENNLLAKSANTIYYTPFGGEVKQRASSLNMITTLDSDYSDGNLSVAYSVDIDGDLETSYDTRAFIDGSVIGEYTEDSTPVSNIVFGNFNGSKTVFYNDASNISYYDSDKTVKTVFDTDRSIAGDLNFVEFNGNPTLVWSENTDDATELFTCSYIDSKWTEPVQLTDTNRAVSNAAVEVLNGQMISVFDSTLTTETENDDGTVSYSKETNLCQMKTYGTTDTEISVGFIDESEFVKGENAALTAFVDNNGTEEINAVEFTISDSSGKTQTYTKSVSIASGDTAIVEIPYYISESFDKTDITITANAVSDKGESADSADYSLGNTDLSIDDLTVEYVGGDYHISGVVTNDSLIEAKDVAVKVGLRDVEDEEIINVVECGDLASGENYLIDYVVSQDEIEFDTDETEIIAYFVVTTTTDELLTENNYSGGVLQKHEHEWGEWETVTEPTCSQVGSSVRICQTCNSEETKELPIDQTKHSYLETVIAPTYEAGGYTLYECEYCHNSYTADFTDKLTKPSDPTTPTQPDNPGTTTPAPTTPSVPTTKPNNTNGTTGSAGNGTATTAPNGNTPTSAQMQQPTVNNSTTSQSNEQAVEEIASKYSVSADTLAIDDAKITNTKSDNDFKGSSYSKLQLQNTKTANKSITVKWNKVNGADGYIVYANKCGKNNKLKKVKTTTSTSFTQKKLKKGTYYKYMVIAYKSVNGQIVTLAASPTLHIATSGGKKGNAKSVKVNKTKLTLKKGKSATIKASAVKDKKPIATHKGIRFESSDKNIVTVSSKGKITAKKKGKATIYCYAQKGKCKKVTVTVK